MMVQIVTRINHFLGGNHTQALRLAINGEVWSLHNGLGKQATANPVCPWDQYRDLQSLLASDAT
jgi:hypothetical protein